MQTEDITSINSNILRDCFSAELLKRTATPSSKPSKRQSTKSNKKRPSYTVSTIQEPVTELQDAEDLADFIEVYLPSLVPIQHDLIPAYTAKPKQYLSTELYSSLPLHLQTLSHETSQPNPPPVEALLPTLPPSLTESLTAYSLLPASTSAQNLLSAVLTGYIAAATAAPSIGLVGKVQAQVKGCEICKRDWIPLTGHHLIPRSVHAKVLKRTFLGGLVFCFALWPC